MSGLPILAHRIEFDPEFTDKGYWTFAFAEFPNGDCYCLYFSQLCAIDELTDVDPCFCPVGLVIVPEVTLNAMSGAVWHLHAKGWFNNLRPVRKSVVSKYSLENWPPTPDPE